MTPPGGLVGLAASVPAFVAAGVTVAVVTSATTVTVLDPMAVIGLLGDSQLSAVEPALVGKQVASAIFGSVSVNPAGAASVGP